MVRVLFWINRCFRSVLLWCYSVTSIACSMFLWLFRQNFQEGKDSSQFRDNVLVQHQPMKGCLIATMFPPLNRRLEKQWFRMYCLMYVFWSILVCTEINRISLLFAISIVCTGGMCEYIDWFPWLSLQSLVFLRNFPVHFSSSGREQIQHTLLYWHE